MIVTAVDPGLMSGVAVVRFDKDDPFGPEKLMDGEIPFEGILDWAEEWIPKTEHLVAERFIINQRTMKASPQPWSIEVIGVLRTQGMRNGIAELQLQSAADAKSFVDNEMLRRLELWHRGGAGHANDALRHAVTRAVKLGWRDERLAPDA